MGTTTPSLVEHGLWRIERSRSTIAFRVRHFGLATVRGRFASFAGEVRADDGGLHVEGTVDVASVDTGSGARDARLRSEFFDAERHPTISLRASAAAGERQLRGELTIHGVTRPIEIALTADVAADGTVRLRGKGKLRRSDFGLEWDALREAGRLLVADDVQLLADVVLARSWRSQAEDGRPEHQHARTQHHRGGDRDRRRSGDLRHREQRHPEDRHDRNPPLR
jgi:polyisoprenoid-binding protein YceI